MRKLVLISVAVAASLCAVAALLATTDDGEVLVPPPEITAEAFMKQLQTKRWDRARPYLAQDLRERTSTGALERFTQTFEEQFGQIEDVHGEETGSDRKDTATGHARIKTNREETQLAFRLVREHREWKIAELPELKD